MPYIGNNHIAGDHTNNFKVLDDISSFTATFDGSATSVVDTTNNTIRVVEHRFIQGQRVTYTNGSGGNIGGLTTGTAYFVIFDSASTIKLATSVSNAASNIAINLSAVGSGSSHTLNAAFDGVNTKFKLTHGSGTDARLNNATQINVAINNVVQRPNLDPNNFTDGFALEDNHKIVFQTAPTSEDIFWGSIIANTLTTFDISDHKIDTFTGDGSTTEFTLSHTPANNESLMVTINGVLQHPSNASTARAYTLIASVIQFTAAPGVGDEIQVRHMGFAGASTPGVSGFYGRTGNVVLGSTDNITTGNINAGIVTATTFDGAFTGNIVGNTATFLGNVSVGGVLTYEDVTNVDSVGIITARDGIFLPDNKKLELGNASGSGDLQLYHNTTNSIIKNNTGELELRSNVLKILGNTGAEASVFNRTGSVDLTYNGVKTFETTNQGIKVTGTSINTQVRLATSTGTVRGYLYANNNDEIYVLDAQAHSILRGKKDGTAALYYNNQQKLDTTNTGINITGNVVGDGLTIDGNADLNGDLDVDGHTNLDNVSIAGVSTFSGNAIFNDKVGIGSAIPEQKLKINVASGNDGVVVQNTSTANIALIGARNGDATLQIGQYGSTASGNVFGIAAANLAFMYTTSYASTHPSALLIGNSSNKDIIFATNATARVRIHDTGQVTIGALASTTVASGILHTKVSNTTSPVVFENDTENADVVIRTTGTNKHSILGFGDGGDNFIGNIDYDHQNNNMVFDTSGAERLRIGSGGIVTQVETGTGNGQGGIRASTASGGGNAGFGFITAGTQRFSVTTIGSAGSESLRVYDVNNSAERLRIDSSGRLLLGTTTEGYSSADDLTVSTSGPTGITIRSGTSNTGTLAFSDGTSGADEYRGYIQYQHQNDALAFASNGTERLRIDSNGKIIVASGTLHASRVLAKFGIDCQGLNIYDGVGVVANYGMAFYNDPTTNKANGIGFFNDDGQTCGGYIVHQDKGSGNLGDIVMATSATSNNPVERLRIQSDGTVRFANKLTNSSSVTSHNANFYGGDVNTGGVRIELAHTTTTVSGNTASGAFPHNLLLSNYSGSGSADNRMVSIGFDIPTTSSHANATIAYQATGSNGVGDLQFWLENGNTSYERARLTAAGAFLVGATSSAGARAIIQQNSSDTNPLDQNTSADSSGVRIQNYSFGTGRYTALSLEACNSSSVQSASIIAQSVASGTSPDIIIAQRTSIGANTERLRITSDGEVHLTTAGYEFTENTFRSKVSESVGNNNPASLSGAMTSMEGSKHSWNNTGGILDLPDYKRSDWQILEVYGEVNPNSGGSGVYSDPFFMIIYQGYGWNGSAVTSYIYAQQFSPMARDVFPSGTGNSGADGMSVVWYNGSSESTSCAYNSTTHYLRIKLDTGSFNTTNGCAASVRIFRRF